MWIRLTAPLPESLDSQSHLQGNHVMLRDSAIHSSPHESILQRHSQVRFRNPARPRRAPGRAIRRLPRYDPYPREHWQRPLKRPRRSLTPRPRCLIFGGGSTYVNMEEHADQTIANFDRRLVHERMPRSYMCTVNPFQVPSRAEHRCAHLSTHVVFPYQPILPQLQLLSAQSKYMYE